MDGLRGRRDFDTRADFRAQVGEFKGEKIGGLSKPPWGGSYSTKRFRRIWGLSTGRCASTCLITIDSSTGSSTFPNYREVHQKHGFAVTTEVLDNIKQIGFHYSTLSAITISVSDMIIPSEKARFIAEAKSGLWRLSADSRGAIFPPKSAPA